MIDILLLAVLAGVTWCVAAEGTWGAATIFLSTLLAGLLAMNFFEPLAATLEQSMPGGTAYWDFVALVGLFAALVFGFRAAGEYLMPTYAEVHGVLHNSLRWLLAVATGYTVVAILLTSLHTAPLPRSFMGFNPGPTRKQFFGLGPDLQWLALNQYVSERGLRGSGPMFDEVSMERIAGQTNTVATFSSFPIRYAMRRSLYFGGMLTAGSASSAAAPAATGPPQSATPSGSQRTEGF